MNFEEKLGKKLKYLVFIQKILIQIKNIMLSFLCTVMEIV